MLEDELVEQLLYERKHGVKINWLRVVFIAVYAITFTLYFCERAAGERALQETLAEAAQMQYERTRPVKEVLPSGLVRWVKR